MAKWQKGQSGNQTGRKKGSKNKTTLAREHAAKEGPNKSLTPLQHMLKLMRDPKQPQAVRMEMAKAAAPYLHPRLKSTEIRNPDREKLVIRVIR